MVECLKNSGYNIGEEQYLLGHKYKTELAFSVGVNQGICERVSKKGRVWFVLPNQLPEAHLRQVHAVKHFIHEKKIDVLKDLYFTYLYNCYAYYHAKVIYTRRDFDEVIKSVLRLQKKLGTKPRTFERQKQLFNLYNNAIVDLIAQIPNECIEIHLEDLLGDTLKTQRRLSDFLGREIDTSIISRDDTWKKTKTVN